MTATPREFIVEDTPLFVDRHRSGAVAEPPEPDIVAIAKHLYAVFEPAFVHAHPDAWFEIAYGDLVTGDVDRAATFSVFEIEEAVAFAAEKNRAGHNIYVGPALRGGDRPHGGRASDRHALTAAFAWVEYDGAGDDARIEAALKEHDLMPAIIVTTGTVPHPRRHLYFKLDGDGTPEKLRLANTSLMKLLGSDAVHNLGRVMRLGGTVSYPKPKKLERGYIVELATIHKKQNAAAYRVERLIELARQASDNKSNGFDHGKTGPRTDDEIVALLEASRVAGEWHNAIRNAIATMIGRGWSDFAIRLACARYCEFADEDHDLDVLIDGAREKWNRPDPGQPSSDDDSEKVDDAWPVLDEAAYHGLAGEIVRLFEPHTESDPVGILLQMLVVFGNIIGHSPYYLVEGDQHHSNLFVALVGTSSKERKGTSSGRVRSITKGADEFWSIERCVSGLSSGEGLINAVRDEVKKWNVKEKCEEILDPGIKDKRLMVEEQEFASALAVMERHGNTISTVIRNAWDDRRLQTMTKSSPLTASQAHISIIAHITEAETRARLTRTDMANGFANRFLFCCVRRSRFLPHGGNLDDTKLMEVASRFREAVDFAKNAGRITVTKAARDAWTLVYPELSAEKPGLLGAVIARAEAQTIRLAQLYALFDRKLAIDAVHLEAAIAVWSYCEASAIRIFGDSLGDPVADEILRALRRTKNGMSRTEIRDLFTRHGRAGQITAALATLLSFGKARFEERRTSGRPVEMWFAVTGKTNERQLPEDLP
jgi:Protein of unknown function (DUF3987)